MWRSLRVFAIVAAIALTGVAIARSAGISGAAGQQKRISPHESVTGTVDGAKLTITYGRPSMRGRAIFGTRRFSSSSKCRTTTICGGATIARDLLSLVNLAALFITERERAFSLLGFGSAGPVLGFANH